MSRRSPGRPPSERSGERPLWRSAVRRLVTTIVADSRKLFQSDDEIRVGVSRSSLQALQGDREQLLAEIPDSSQANIPGVQVTLRGMFRMIIENSPLDPEEVAHGMAFIAEVQNCLDSLIGPLVVEDRRARGIDPGLN